MNVHVTSRHLAYFLCVAVLATLAALIPQAQGQAHASGNPDEVSVSTTVYVPVVTPVVRQSRPAEDDPGFNPCTMGVDGRYAETDYRHWTPGPCTMATRLPYGARFTVATAPIGDTANCLTRVAVVDTTGQSIALGAWWSTRCDAPADIAPLLRAAAAQL
jgi:hypothetical protein